MRLLPNRAVYRESKVQAVRQEPRPPNDSTVRRISGSERIAVFLSRFFAFFGPLFPGPASIAGPYLLILEQVRR